MNVSNFEARFPLVVGFALIVSFSFPSRSLGQPTQTPAPPTEQDVQKFFEDKRKSESSDRIQTVEIQTARVETKNRGVSYSALFFARVHFAEACIWDVQANGSPLSFRTLDLQRGRTNKPGCLEVSRRGQGYLLSGELVFERKANQWIVNEVKVRSYPKQSERQDYGRISCVNNLKQIAVALHTWAMTHSNAFAFNLSTNVGGTKELCVNTTDGFEAHPEIHLRAMAGRQLSLKTLVCPADSKKPAAGFDSLQATNISYQFRVGDSLTLTNSDEILCQCPIHAEAISCDTRIKQLKPPTN